MTSKKLQHGHVHQAKVFMHTEPIQQDMQSLWHGLDILYVQPDKLHSPADDGTDCHLKSSFLLSVRLHVRD